ncbi:MAG: type II toxin-antitoxin system HigB family toxin [Proteobacteria bacterium]|nr:type II toxin-antitoxin system HigB family toxin [Pseudomonadota bacterium]
MLVVGTNLAERYFAQHVGAKGIKAARAQYAAWLALAQGSRWRRPEDIKMAHPRASILKGSRVVFNIKGNDYRLIAIVEYAVGTIAIRFFGTHAEYDKIDAGTV